MREITEGFDDAFGKIGLDYDKARDINDIADVISSVLCQLHDFMKENDLYEKYPMSNSVGKEGGNVFDEYNRLLAHNVQEGLVQETANGYRYVYAGSLGNTLSESSLKAAAEVLNETIGREYSITFSYENKYHDSSLLFEDASTGKKYEIDSKDGELENIIDDFKQVQRD